MSCCYDSAKYAPLEMSEEATAKAISATSCDRFPGASRATSNETPPPGSILLKTGGNAFAAIDKSLASDPSIVSVSVPEGVKPGQQIYVTAPDGSGRYVSVTVPEGALPGHVFLVKFPLVEPLVATGVPVEEADAATKKAAVRGEDIDMEDILLTQQAVKDVHNDCQSQNQNLMLVRVPPGTRPGDKIRTQVLQCDQYMTVEAVVPEGNISQFYVRLPPRENMLDNHPPPSHKKGELVLVQVPSGVAAGSTIRVALPGGLMVDAVVPEGNVSQFYVRAPNQNQSEQHSIGNASAPRSMPSIV